MTKAVSKVEVDLDWPVDCEDGISINKITVYRPKGKTIKRLIAMLGPEFVKQLVGEVSARKDKSDSTLSTERIAEIVASLATIEQLDALSEVLASMTDQPSSVIDEIDPADYPKFEVVLSSFFPGLFSNGDPLPQT